MTLSCPQFAPLAPRAANTRMRRWRILIIVSLLLLSWKSAHAADVLLVDDYGGLPLGMFSGGVVGAMTEYHYLPAAG